MTSRERVAKALRHDKPDRVPVYEAFWEATSNSWHGQGLPEGVSPDDYFETEIRLIGLDNSFGFAPEDPPQKRKQAMRAWRNWLEAGSPKTPLRNRQGSGTGGG